MDMRDFFYFIHNPPANAVQVGLVGRDIDFDYERLIRGDYEAVEFPLVFQREYGKKYYDILGVGYPGLCLISNRIKTLLEEGQCTGWQTFSVKLYDKSGEEVRGYWGLSFCGHCGPIFYKTADIIEKRWIPEGPICKYYRGMYINSWDGSDFFISQGTGHMFVTKKVADLFVKNKIKHISLENLAETEIDVTIVSPSKVRDEAE